MGFGHTGFFVIGEFISNLIGFEPTKGFLHGVAVFYAKDCIHYASCNHQSINDNSPLMSLAALNGTQRLPDERRFWQAEAGRLLGLCMHPSCPGDGFYSFSSSTVAINFHLSVRSQSRVLASNSPKSLANA
jgi:hypothetical protein